MNFTCGKQDILKAINIVSKAASKLQKTVLECIMFECEEGTVTLKATDIDLSIKTQINAEIAEKGSILVPAKYLFEIINKFPDNEINFKSEDGSKVEISCLNSRICLSCMDSDEFPAFPFIEKNSTVKITEKELRSMINDTIFAAAQTFERPILTGEMIKVSNGEIEVVALDGYRMAIRKQEVISDMEISMVVPGRTMREIAKIASDSEETVKIAVAGNMALFEMENTEVYTRLLEGEYIKYRNLIPAESTLNVIVEKEMLRESIERAMILAREGNNNLVIMSFDDGVLNITSESEIGNIRENIPVMQTGENITIGFNAKYILDLLKSIDDSEIKMLFNTQVTPCLVTAHNKSGYEYLILPVKI